MFTVVITEKGGAQRRMEFDKNEVTIGRVQGNDIILPKGNVSKRHSRIVLKDNRFIVVDLKSTNGTYVNGRKITSPLVVKPGDKIYIGDFIMTVEESAEAAQPAAPAPAFDEPPPPQPSSSPPAPRRSAATPPPLRASSQGAPPPLPAYDDAGPTSAPEPDRFPLDEEPSGESPPPRVSPPAGRSRKRTVQEQEPPDHGQPMANAPATLAPPPRGPEPSGAPSTPAPAPSAPSAPPPRMQAPAPVPVAPVAPPVAQAPVVPDRPGLEGALRAVIGRVSRVMDVHNSDPGALHDQGRWGAAQQAAEDAIAQLSAEGLLNDQDAGDLAGIAVREIVGLGALEGLLSDDAVREIVVEGPRRISADFGRGLERAPGVFSSADAVVTVGRRLLAQGGGQFVSNRFIQHGTLPYGPHVTVILPPVAVRGPIIEIRRMAGGLDAAALVSRGVLSDEVLDVVRDALSARKNVAVLGPVGAGVTTVLGALAGLAASNGTRVVTAEDTPDLAIAGENVISLGTGGADSGMRLRDVVRQAAALRADHLVVDDVRGVDAIDVFSELAARSGGDFLGVHAHGKAADALMGMARLGSKAQDGALADLLARAVHVVVEVSRDEDGGHRVVRVTEITGANGKGLATQDLFVHDGELQSTGASPSFRV